MQQISINQLNGTSGGSLRQKMDLSDVCQSTDAFAMLFMQLMGQTLQLGQAIPMQGDHLNLQNDAILAANAVQNNAQPGILAQAAVDGSMTGNSSLILAEEMLSQNAGIDVQGGIPGTQAAKEGNAEPVSAEPKSEDMKQLYTVLKTAWSGEQTDNSLKNRISELEAGNSIRAAKQLLEQQERETVVPVDIESLQADVNAGRFLSAKMETADHALPSAGEIGKQLRTGILNQTAQGKSEFIVRLAPEGIGEVVVKISDDREHMSLSIFTSSPQAARLISNEVTALQEALRPLQAQVEQVVMLPSDQMASYASQNAFADQRQSSSQQYFEQRQQHRDGRWREDDDSFDAVIDQVQTLDGELDAYI